MRPLRPSLVSPLSDDKSVAHLSDSVLGTSVLNSYRFLDVLSFPRETCSSQIMFTHHLACLADLEDQQRGGRKQECGVGP